MKNITNKKLQVTSYTLQVTKKILLFCSSAFLLFCFSPLFAQVTHYSDNHYGNFATSESRVVITINEFEENSEVHLEALLIGEFNVGTFQINLHYDPTVVVPIMGPGGVEITSKLSGSGKLLGNYLWLNPQLPNLNTWRTISSGQVNPQGNNPWTFIMAGGNEGLNTNLSLPAGEILQVFKIYFKKLPGQKLASNTFTYYEKQNIPIVRNLFSRGLSFVNMSECANNGLGFLDTKLFSRRIPSSVKTTTVEVDGIKATLKGIANSEGLDKLPANPGVCGGLDWDNITTTGFIFSKNDLNLTMDVYSKKIKVEDMEYDFPAIENGIFTLGEETFYIISHKNVQNKTFIEMKETVTNLEPEETYYAFGFMKYRFQTSDEYPVLSERITFDTGIDCENGMPVVVAMSEPEIFLYENETLYLYVEVENDAHFQWYFENNMIDGATEPNYTVLFDATKLGVYSVAISNECGSLLHFFNVKLKTVGIKIHEKQEAKLTVFPNPAKNTEELIFLLELPANEKPDAVAYLYDMNGKLITSYEINDYKTKVSAPFSSGTYLIKTITKNGRKLETKLLIQR